MSITFTVEIAGQRAGADWDIQIPITDEADAPLVWPAGASFRIHVREKLSSTVVLMALTSAASEIIATDGELRLVVASAKTALLPAGRLVFDVEMTVGGKKEIDIGGTIEVLTPVTRGA